jgi:hypothetical protein
VCATSETAPTSRAQSLAYGADPLSSTTKLWPLARDCCLFWTGYKVRSLVRCTEGDGSEWCAQVITPQVTEGRDREAQGIRSFAKVEMKTRTLHSPNISNFGV